MNNKQFATIKKLNEIHSKLKEQFQNKTDDIVEAQQLEDFFNYIVYDKEDINIITNPFLKGITVETKNLIKNSPYIQNLNILHNVGGQKQLSGIAGEQAMSYLVLQAIGRLDSNFQQILERNGKELIEQMIMGNVQATTLTKNIAETITTKAMIEGNKAFQRIQKKYGAYAFRQGKIDINASLLQLNIFLNQEAQKLLHLTASVKNYQSAIIHLETVNRKKAYQGIMANLYPNISAQQSGEIFEYYYQKKAVKTSEIAAKHFLHITNLYALSGLGQIYIDKVTNEIIEAKLGAKYLIANIAGKEIIVVPVSRIAVNIHNPKYGDLFSYEGKEKTLWEQQKTIPVYLNLNKYKKLK